LKGRGFKPGMGLNDLYSTILAGRPGLNRADSGGTVNQHVELMKGAMAALARKFLGGSGQTDPHKPGFDANAVKYHDYYAAPAGADSAAGDAWHAAAIDPRQRHGAVGDLSTQAWLRKYGMGGLDQL
jgi:hypothetical protein